MIETTIKTDEKGMFFPHDRVVEYFEMKVKLIRLAALMNDDDLHFVSKSDIDVILNQKKEAESDE